MNAFWILVCLGAAVAVVAFATFRRGDHSPDLGAVSAHWIAEQRLGSGQDSRR